MAIARRTFISCQEEVLSHQFSAQQYRDLVKVWLVEAVQEIVRSTELRTAQQSASFSVVSGESTLEVPADFSRIIDLHRTNPSYLLSQLTLQEYDSLEATTGAPQCYVVSRGDLVLYPTPDASYSLSLRYWKLPADMEADADEVPLPILYQTLPIAYAMKMAYARENDYQAAAYWAGEWGKGLAKMKGEVVQEMMDGPTQVSGGWENSSSYPAITYP